MNHTLSDSQLEAMIKSAVNSSGPLPPDEKFTQLISALRELQERRKADSEPVAEVVSIYGDPEAFGEREIRPLVGIQQMPYGTKLYRHAQQPVVPATLPCSVELKPGLIIGKGCKTETLLTALRRRADYNAEIDAMTPEERAEYDANIEAFKAMLPQPAQAAPVVPDGYVTVPREPTDEMIAAAMNCEDVLFNSDDSFCVQFGNIYEAMLAAAPHDAINALIPLVSRNEQEVK